MNKLDEEQTTEFRENFNEFSKGKPMVDAKTLQGLMRHMGVLQSDAETLEMIRECGGSNGIDLNQFLNWMGNKMTQNDTPDDLVLAFKAFDKDGSGYITTVELRYVLCCVGDKLDDELVETILEQADRGGSGSVNYESFIKSMMRY